MALWAVGLMFVAMSVWAWGEGSSGPSLHWGPISMPFLPDFNLLLHGWVHPNNPDNGDPPDFVDIPCQLYYESRQGSSAISYMSSQEWPTSVVFRMPLGEIVEWMGAWIVGWNDPLGNDTYYRPFFKQRVHAGFPNEYLAMLCVQCADDGTPSAQFVIPF